MGQVVLKVNEKIFNFLKNSDKIINVLEGGSSSGKTYTLLHFFILNCLEDIWNNYTIDIVRDTMPFLRISVMKDFFDILDQMQIYDVNCHNKTENTYKIGSNVFRFYSADDRNKAHGARRDILLLNEMITMKKATVDQMMLRTRVRVYIDYNPSESDHWVYHEIADNPDYGFNQSCYLDNPFVPEMARKIILRYKETDDEMWKIYGLGERGASLTKIYPNWKYAVDRNGNDVSFDRFEGQRLFGMDFGYNDPTTLIRVKYHETGGIFAEELLYKKELTSEQIITELDKIRVDGKITYDDTILADSARPEIIEDIKKAGYNIRGVKKGKDSILRGINFIKRHLFFITKESTNLIKETRGYKWKVDKDENVLDTPVDLNDHTLDALRYAVEKFSRNRKEVGVA